MAQNGSKTIWGGPTKRFFVSMLPRDIALKDAILDLVDNSIDGATRQIPRAQLRKPNAYLGYQASLTINGKSFDISDNCGGIPKDRIADAFLLGRPKLDKKVPTIGMYGIGLKRAIFKIGEEAMVESYASDGAFSVAYDRDWLSPENETWDLPVEPIQNKKAKGVTVVIPSLRKEIAREFENPAFLNDLKLSLAAHFGYLMQKGFSIRVNGETLHPHTLKLYTSEFARKDAVRPYDFESEDEGVHVRVTVGFYRPLARIEDVDEAAERSDESEDAGISVICNDRLVLINDKTRKTGWGDGGVPAYHPQFRGIAGFIMFSTDRPEKLPISTTKRDLDVGEEIYLHARQYCMEGLRECVNFTNRWKGMEDEASAHFHRSERRDVRNEIRLAADHGNAVRGNPKAKKLSASLPVPETRNPMRRISFTRKDSAIVAVSSYLFNESGLAPSLVGQECFDRTLKAATQK